MVFLETSECVVIASDSGSVRSTSGSSSQSCSVGSVSPKSSRSADRVQVSRKPTSCLRPGRIEDDFSLASKVLGTGLSGEVREGICLHTGRAFAVKTFKLKSLSARHLANLRHEVDVLSSVNHRNIVQVEAVYETDDKVHLVLEKFTGGEVFDQLVCQGRFNEPNAASVAVQVLRAIAHLHKRNIVHRDLKPENLMYQDALLQDVKLIDFGFATRIEPGTQLNQMCGTIQYIAPEVLRRDGYDERADIWSIGSVIYTLLTNKVMYSGEDSEIKRKNKIGAIDFSRTFRTVSQEGRSFVNWLLTVDPAARPTATEALRHPWLWMFVPEEVEAALEEVALDEARTPSELVAVPRAQLRLQAPSDPEEKSSTVQAGDRNPTLLERGHKVASSVKLFNN